MCVLAHEPWDVRNTRRLSAHINVTSKNVFCTYFIQMVENTVLVKCYTREIFCAHILWENRGNTDSHLSLPLFRNHCKGSSLTLVFNCFITCLFLEWMLNKSVITATTKIVNKCGTGTQNPPLIVFGFFIQSYSILRLGLHLLQNTFYKIKISCF